MGLHPVLFSKKKKYGSFYLNCQLYCNSSVACVEDDATQQSKGKILTLVLWNLLHVNLAYSYETRVWDSLHVLR